MHIAENILEMETLETRNSDSLDFYVKPIWAIRYAVYSAYQAGKQDNDIVKRDAISLDKYICKKLGRLTVETRNSDRLDFIEVSVWGIYELLSYAYDKGRLAR